MTGKKKTGEKAVKEKPAEKISLIVFKQIRGITNITYAGFKASLQADDSTEYTQKQFEDKYRQYKEQKAFNKKVKEE